MICPHCGMDTDEPLPPPEAAEPELVTRVRSRQTDHCADCGNRFETGDEVVLLGSLDDPDRIRLIHEACLT